MYLYFLTENAVDSQNKEKLKAFHGFQPQCSSKGEIHENMVRKDFTPSEMVAVKRMLEPEVKAKTNPKGRPRRGTNKNLTIFQNNPNKRKSLSIVASFTGEILVYGLVLEFLALISWVFSIFSLIAHSMNC